MLYGLLPRPESERLNMKTKKDQRIQELEAINRRMCLQMEIDPSFKPNLKDTIARLKEYTRLVEGRNHPDYKPIVVDAD